ncbi:MAG: acyl-CoA dehydrogenase family protein, partial [Bdellovibrionota bacterium]
TLGNQYDDDLALRRYLRQALPPEMLSEIELSLREMGELAGGALYRQQMEELDLEPKLTQWDPWGNRVDQIEHTPLWKSAERLASEKGVVATAHERKHGDFSRIHQFALAYLFTSSTDIYSCPLAMTDGAAVTLKKSGNQDLMKRALPHLLSRDPERFWTSGQWMTELAGGSDVGLSESTASKGPDGQWRLSGRKWFTSAASSQMALTLARPNGQGPGGQNLALFYVEPRDSMGQLQGVEIARLKNKLGTRKLPTAEIFLNDTPALLVMGLTDGVRNIAPMLNITRTWNSITAVSFMRRGLALVEDYSRKRFAFGGTLDTKPLHRATVHQMQTEFEGALLMSFRLAELLGACEASGSADSGDQGLLLRLLTSVTKAYTAKQAIRVVAEAIECFGGAGYVEDTGLPQLLRDTHVLSIWEGTTNVLALDALKTAKKEGAWDPYRREIERLLARWPADRSQTEILRQLKWQETWLVKTEGPHLEAGAREFLFSLGATLQQALLGASWSQGIHP